MKAHLLPTSLLTAFLLAVGMAVCAKPHHPCPDCGINGSTTVVYGNSLTFTINGICSGGDVTSWGVSCGTVTSSSPSGATILFNSPGCNSATVTAYSSGTPLATKTVTITAPTLTAGAINNPSPTYANWNSSPGTLTTQAATGGNCSSYSYQWQSSDFSATSNFSDITGATGQDYTPGNITSTVWFRRQVTCGSQTANTTAIEVDAYPPLQAGIVSPSSQTINNGATPSALSTTAATGGSSSYTYQWQSSPDSTFALPTNVGTNATNYQPPALTDTTYYRVQVNSNGAIAYTNWVVIDVYPPLSIGSLSPSSQTINYNRAPGMLSLAGTAGGSGTYVYVWASAPAAAGPYTTIGSTSVPTYTPPPIADTTYYEVTAYSVVNGNLATGVTSNSVLVNVNPQVVVGSITPGNQTLASGTGPGVLSVNAAHGGICGGSFTYGWQSSPDGVTWTTIGGAAGLTYDPGTLTTSTSYRVMVICATDTEYTAAVAMTIGTIATNLNYIQTRTINLAGVTDPYTASELTDPADVQQTTAFFDGLGRPIQTVAWQASPLLKDVVSPQAYDPFGREIIHYLPYTSDSSNGTYKPDPTAEQYHFNAAQFPGEQFFYGQTVFESSPLNRTTATYAPGSSWVGNGRGVGMQYLVNQAADSVRLWTISYPAGSLPTTSAIYADGTLYKTVTTDEAGHSVVEYKDLEGHVVLKKVQEATTPGTAHVGWLCTYYVYDDLNHLRFVLQPRAVELINSSWTITTTIAAELCFRYEYDAHDHMIIKKIPGAGETWMVYDSRDRLVMTQDSAMRGSHQWLYTKYDCQNRPDSTGLITDGSNYNNLAYHETNAFASSNYPSVGSYTNELLTKTYYDDYSWVSGTGTSIGSAMATGNLANSSYFNTDYNDYPTYAVPITPYYQARNLVTGTMKKVLGTTSQYLYDVNFYDDRGRISQTQAVNYTGAIDTVTSQYDFLGKPLRTLLQHGKNGNTAQGHTILTKMDYDPGFRLAHLYKNIDNAASDQLIAAMQYNELGQLALKDLGNVVDSELYIYNIRGWLTAINPNFIAGTANHYFGMELGYDKDSSLAAGTTYSNLSYTGNIAGTVWKSAGAGINRKYDFTYDNLNRLTGAAFLQNTSGSAWDKTRVDFSVSNLTYDANGNILSMAQNGFTVGGSAPIDQLHYSYGNSGVSNRLQAVTDTANADSSSLGDFHYKAATKQSTDYSYDGNGNLSQDNNKAIDKITYNYLNLPQLIHVNGKGNISYVYDAAGTKLAKITADSLARHSTTTLYIGGLQYQQSDTITNPGGGVDTLQFIGHEEGRARWAYHKYTNGATGYGWEYDFFEKDHLGNTRVVLTQQRDTANYLASMEGAYRATESQLFANIAETSYPRSSVPGYPTDVSVTNPNDSVSKVDYTGTGGQKTGPSLLLKVMAGDTVQLAVQSYYNSGSGTTNNSSFTDVLTSLATGLVNATGGIHGGVGQLTGSGSSVYTGLTSFLTNNESAPSGYPKAYLNWIFLDDQFNYVSPLSGAIQAASSTYPAGTLNAVAPGAPLAMNRSGYLYIWVSNETQGWDVFFDNLSIQHQQGPMVEEEHYYPGGLTMAGISDKAIMPNYSENKYRYNDKELQNKEFSDGTGLEEYDFGSRFQDPQLGLWHNIDPKSESNRRYSPYSYGLDNPMKFIDPDGMLPGDFLDEHGKNIGNDGKNDGKLYVVKTTEKKFDGGVNSAGISKSDAKSTTEFIKNNSGNTAAFDANKSVYNNVQEIEGNKDIRQKMVDIVNQDDGRGGTADKNNREYGGTIAANGAVIEAAPGPISTPGNPAEIQLKTFDNTVAEFHDHPSGTTDDRDRTSTGSSNTVGGTTTFSAYKESPSKTDIQNVGNRTGYEFGLPNGTLYIYNSQGVTATLPISRFVNPK